jgi:lipopolysaccharide export system protein LptA
VKNSVLILGLFFLCAITVSADTITYSGNRQKSEFAQGRERTILEGNARFSSDSYEIYADQIELYGEDFRFVVCKGNVTVIELEKDYTIYCENLFYDRDQGLIRIEGPVEMIDIQNEVVVRGSYLENRDSNNETLIQVMVRIYKNDLICRAEFARYDRNNSMLYLTGIPRVIRGTDTFEAEQITINLDTEEIFLEGEVKGNISQTEEEQTDEEIIAEESSQIPPEETESNNDQ